MRAVRRPQWRRYHLLPATIPAIVSTALAQNWLSVPTISIDVLYQSTMDTKPAAAPLGGHKATLMNMDIIELDSMFDDNLLLLYFYVFT